MGIGAAFRLDSSSRRCSPTASRRSAGRGKASRPRPGQRAGSAAQRIGRARARRPSASTPQAAHAIIVEVETGTVLLDKAADERDPAGFVEQADDRLCRLRHAEKGQAAKLTDELPVSEEAWRLGGSKMFVPLGGKVTIDDLVHGMIIQSGNDACVVLAEGLAGSEQAFVDLMNKTAKEIGLKHSHFANVDRPARPEWLGDGARPGDPGDPHDQGLSRILQDLRREGIHLQQHQAGQPQSAALRE